jgi:polyhydroxybutyrate depolymerase
VRGALVLAVAACSSPNKVGPTIDAPPSPDAPPDAGPCGVRTGQRGMTSRKITVNGVDRTYIVYLPSALDPQTPLPLVFVHHGYSMSGQNMFDVTGYPALADSEHIALAFPDGQSGPGVLGPPWNVGANVCPSSAGAPPNATGDDFAFLDTMRADISQDQCLDLAHVYVTGFSMGGYFSHHAGCMKPGIRGVAPHSGGTHTLDRCTNGHMPVIMFHGLSDPLIPDGCEDPGGTTPAGFTAAATEWAEKNGCATTTQTVAVNNGSCAIYDGCPADGQVEICTFNAMGHCWAGGATNSFYACANYESATQLEWDFFKQHAW